MATQATLSSVSYCEVHQAKKTYEQENENRRHRRHWPHREKTGKHAAGGSHDSELSATHLKSTSDKLFRNIPTTTKPT
jgi:hypothetical protein